MLRRNIGMNWGDGKFKITYTSFFLIIHIKKKNVSLLCFNVVYCILKLGELFLFLILNVLSN